VHKSAQLMFCFFRSVLSQVCLKSVSRPAWVYSWPTETEEKETSAGMASTSKNIPVFYLHTTNREKKIHFTKQPSIHLTGLVLKVTGNIKTRIALI